MRHIVAPPGSSRDLNTALRTAAMFDPGLFRAFWRLYGMLEKPNRVYTDPAVVACTRQTLRQLDASPAIPQPSREQLVAALTSQCNDRHGGRSQTKD
jgi:hypothetical protein